MDRRRIGRIRLNPTESNLRGLKTPQSKPIKASQAGQCPGLEERTAGQEGSGQWLVVRG